MKNIQIYVRILLLAMAAAPFWCWLIVVVELPTTAPQPPTYLYNRNMMSNGHSIG